MGCSYSVSPLLSFHTPFPYLSDLDANRSRFWWWRRGKIRRSLVTGTTNGCEATPYSRFKSGATPQFYERRKWKRYV
ncbi:hypothetical protein EUTSA_v10015848mg [Eutrema salsugineum]|uniref:Uncharacterized protein n=1 Tax=Eutrema salsugineum TaxID=72664 RepID=V4LMG8_EUTSA|nr:hypothetical protein EUTSA_v10015848mg [Eutrema salsugineum]